MPEFDVPQTDSPQPDAILPSHPLHAGEEFDELSMPEGGSTAREGLPASYRMRADRHYIDHLASGSVGVPVRLIPVNQIDQMGQAEAMPAAPGDTLARSIAAHGVLQPLLVAKRDGRYRVIAGRRRLAAAVAAGLTAVPCLLHDVGEAEAAALADADNLRGVSPDASSARALPVNVADVLQEILADLIRLNQSASLLRHSPAGSVYQKTSIDLVAAQAWRTSWLAGATAFMLGERRPAGRMRPLAAIVERVLHGFEPELRLSGGQLRASVTTASSVVLDSALGELALTGAILATLFVLQAVEQPVVDVRAHAADGVATLEVVQQLVPIPPDVARGFSESAPVGKGQLVIGLAATSMREIAAQLRGSVEAVGEGRRGGVIRCAFRL